MLCTQFYCNTPTHQLIGLDSHFSGESVSFRDYTLPVKIDMSAPGYKLANVETARINKALIAWNS
jgi:hypothetical protein